jgi:hypothetical protein
MNISNGGGRFVRSHAKDAEMRKCVGWQVIFSEEYLTKV